jgi:hypothetical protein
VISAAAAAALPCNLLIIGAAALAPWTLLDEPRQKELSRGAFQTCSEPVLNLFHFSRLPPTPARHVISLFHKTFEAAFGLQMNLFWTEPPPLITLPAQKPKIELRAESPETYFTFKHN